MDWFGKKSGAAEYIWIAHVRDGVLVGLENGRPPDEAIRRLIELGHAHQRTVVGLDFAFSFPEWFLDDRDWHGGRDVWDALRTQTESILADCPSPFWGRPGKKNLHGQETRAPHREGRRRPPSRSRSSR